MIETWCFFSFVPAYDIDERETMRSELLRVMITAIYLPGPKRLRVGKSW